MSVANLELKSLRIKNGLTQESISALLNMTVSTFNRKENGIREFSVNEAEKISRLFGISIEEIFFNY